MSGLRTLARQRWFEKIASEIKGKGMAVVSLKSGNRQIDVSMFEAEVLSRGWEFLRRGEKYYITKG